MPRIYTYTAGDAQSHKELGNILRELPSGRYVIKIKKNLPIRSLSQNKFYHYILNIICINTGFTHEELHEALKQKFNAKMIDFPKSGSQVIGKSTAKLDVGEFIGYVNRVRQWAIEEFGIVIEERDKISQQQWDSSEEAYEENQQG